MKLRTTLPRKTRKRPDNLLKDERPSRRGLQRLRRALSEIPAPKPLWRPHTFRTSLVSKMGVKFPHFAYLYSQGDVPAFSSRC